MKPYTQVALAIIFMVAFSHMALVLGLECNSDCAACWKIGDTTGVDTKFSCNNGYCGTVCPEGYHDIHCARDSRCL